MAQDLKAAYFRGKVCILEVLIYFKLNLVIYLVFLQFTQSGESSPISELMEACDGHLEVVACAAAVLLHSLRAAREKVAVYLTWAQERGFLKAEVQVQNRMPRFWVGRLSWVNCPTLQALLWKLPTLGMTLRYSGID